MRPASKEGPLGERPIRQFFMNLRDIAFWVRSARADAYLALLRDKHGTARAFDLLYDRVEDPWGTGVAHYRYQRRKYDVLLSFLPKRHYRRALDLGCGRGEMTRRLAPQVDEVLGLDLSNPALEQARRLSANLPNVCYGQADVIALDSSLDGEFDLVVLADTLYYVSPLDDAVLKDLRESVVRLLAPGGTLLLANHFFSGFDQDSRTSRRIHDSFRWAPGLRLEAEHRRPFYLASLFERVSRAQEGLSR
jgi:predicted TPR repeat methyltransferase